MTVHYLQIPVFVAVEAMLVRQVHAYCPMQRARLYWVRLPDVGSLYERG